MILSLSAFFRDCLYWPWRLGVLVLFASWLSGCGNKGPLILPSAPPKTTPVPAQPTVSPGQSDANGDTDGTEPDASLPPTLSPL